MEALTVGVVVWDGIGVIVREGVTVIVFDAGTSSIGLTTLHDASSIIRINDISNPIVK